MPKLKETDEERLISVFLSAMGEMRWTQSHLAEVCGFCPAKVSRILNHPMDQKFSDLSVVAKKLKIGSLPIM